MRLGDLLAVGRTVRPAAAPADPGPPGAGGWKASDAGTVPAATSRWRLPAWLENVLLALLRPGNRRRGTRWRPAGEGFASVTVVRNDLTMADVEVVVVDRRATGGGPDGGSGAGIRRRWKKNGWALWSQR